MSVVAAPGLSVPFGLVPVVSVTNIECPVAKRPTETAQVGIFGILGKQAERHREGVSGPHRSNQLRCTYLANYRGQERFAAKRRQLKRTQRPTLTTNRRCCLRL